MRAIANRLSPNADWLALTRAKSPTSETEERLQRVGTRFNVGLEGCTSGLREQLLQEAQELGSRHRSVLTQQRADEGLGGLDPLGQRSDSRVRGHAAQTRIHSVSQETEQSHLTAPSASARLLEKRDKVRQDHTSPTQVWW